MRGVVFSSLRANRVWDILEAECGASPAGREDFVVQATLYGITEYRFMGSLGFGGKFWHDMRVSCYPEDRTPERDAMIAKANSRLAWL